MNDIGDSTAQGKDKTIAINALGMTLSVSILQIFSTFRLILGWDRNKKRPIQYRPLIINTA
jgi:hypothetical protein